MSQGAVRSRGGLLEQAVQKDEGQQAAAQTIERRVFEPLDAAVGFPGAHVHQLGERGLRDGEILPAAVHDEGGNDGEGEGNAQAEDGALAGVAVDFDLAADFFDVGADHVHADAASGDAGDGGSGGEAGQKDELQDFALVHLLGALRGNELALDGLLADPLDAHAGAVVVHFNDDVAAFVTGAQANQAFSGLALGDANVGHLDAVVDGVADGMGEGIADGLEQALVELGFLAFHFEADALVEAEGEIADQAREAREDMADRLHARLHDGFAQIGGDHIEAAAEQRQKLASALVAWRIWLRVRTSSPTRFIMRLSSSTSTRSVESAAPGVAAAGASGGGGAAASRAAQEAKRTATAGAGRGSGSGSRGAASTSLGGPASPGSVPGEAHLEGHRGRRGAALGLGCAVCAACRDARGAATTAASTGSATATAASPRCNSSRRAIMALSSCGLSPSAPVVSMERRTPRRTSMSASRPLMMPGLAASLPSRSRPRRFSPACESASRRLKPRKPVVPLMVCTERKISASSSVSPGRVSRSVRHRSMRSRPSWLSSRNSRVRSSTKWLSDGG